ncbi:Crp/Fnr family transcriptional regulator [Clostridium sp.]|uniref:Crp/Fnr family transcriptional regulator n=1 Tax=Clostridium sp. TaxID=1506 RepID=UPI00321749E3
MKNITEKIKKNYLFKGLSSEDLVKIFASIKYHINSYNKGEIIAHEEDPCNSIGLLISGNVEIQRIYSSGKYIVLSKLNEGDVFGEAIIFSKQKNYPATVIALNKCEILYVNKNEILELFSREEKILENFLELLSNKILMMNSKIKNLSLKSIKHRVINYILIKMKNQQSKIIKLDESKENIAAAIGIPRPSLSRELINLRDLGYIEFDRTSIKILDLDGLEDAMFE